MEILNAKGEQEAPLTSEVGWMNVSTFRSWLWKECLYHKDHIILLVILNVVLFQDKSRCREIYELIWSKYGCNPKRHFFNTQRRRRGSLKGYSTRHFSTLYHFVSIDGSIANSEIAFMRFPTILSSLKPMSKFLACCVWNQPLVFIHFGPIGSLWMIYHLNVLQLLSWMKCPTS